MERALRTDAFAGQTHIVTGAGQGIGRSVATALAIHGASVAMVDLDPGRVAEAAQEISKTAGSSPLVIGANVAEERDVQRAVARALEWNGALNGVVNVAGITKDARIVKKSLADFRAVLEVHLVGTFLFTREIAVQHWHELFKKGGNQPLRDGVNRSIVNFSSVSARNGNVGQVDYTAAKGGIESLTKTAAREFASYGARVNAIAPGPVRTPMLAAVGDAGIAAMAAATLVGRVAEPEDIAATVAAITDGRLFGYTTGQVFAANGGMYLD
jgi:3-oxoacyl-[acyl-carrier protein] reductase